jgi:hypothetical protein
MAEEKVVSVLPTKAHVPIVGMPPYFKMIIEGPSKVGKTTFAASFPDAVMIECEPGGANHVACSGMLDVSKGKNPLEGIRRAIEELKSDTRFKTVILDTIDAAADLVSKDVCKKLGIETIADSPKKERHGVQWEKYANEVTGLVGALIALPKNVIVLGHTKPATYEGEGDKRVMRNPEGLDIYGKAARILYARVDNIGHLKVINEGGQLKRVLSFRGGLDCTRGSRHPMLSDKEIILPAIGGYSVFERVFTPEAK